MPEINSIDFDASLINSKGGSDLIDYIKGKILPAMKGQNKYYGEVSMIVCEGVDKKPKKKGCNKKQDEKIERALRRLCGVMQDVVDPQRKFDGNPDNICGVVIYDNIEIRDGVEPHEKDIHVYTLIWYKEVGYDFKKRLKREISKEPFPGTILRTWDFKTKEKTED
uniref:Uncharacterized protein n=1 Tax=candidate division CPR3 bacterium TaxID=2268181 RepID=A0A7C4M307_UNCC3